MARRVIVLKGDPIFTEDTDAAEAITPGHLISRGSGGTFSKNTTAANQAIVHAVERVELGQDIDDAYAANDRVKAAHCKPGDRIYALIASGSNVAIGDYLCPSTTGGLLTKTGVTTTLRTHQALEAVDATAGAVAGTRCRVEVV